ncbi:hypothetical protein [Cognatiluteimonas telluris]|jgi:hypothetical protein|uniref:hypothetical protein n=1 Tax=Cognatiluteimonas telluris TaxID=1104775 RepID=UPI001407BA33|nr:hypothetical protein [Lysobacter telluris]
MSFESLIEKVRQAENALEARERQTAADWRQAKASWRDLWTPGRLLSVGLVSGFLVGKVEPARRMTRGSGALQLISAVAGLFAGGSAQAAAGDAEHAAAKAQQTVDAVTPTGADADATTPSSAAAVPPSQRPRPTPESLRAAGLL